MKYTLKTSGPRPQSSFDPDRDLNPQQRAVVEAPVGRVLVLAGAGSGKTRTLTYRVARLVAGGCAPERVLLCTFTNRAAREMTGRVEALLGVEMRRCAAGTFHHVGNRILRRHAERLGMSQDFGILDPEDARTLLAAVIAEQDRRLLTQRRFPQPRMLHSLIGLAAGTRLTLREAVEAHAPKLVDQTEMMEKVARDFAERKRRMNLADFDDLLIHWHTLMTDPQHVEAASELQAAYDHVLVDEYQDINALQGTLCDAMAARSGSLTCVGDDAQSIYAFRGADFTQIRRFRERHADAQVLELTINYRSTPQILELANRSIANNRDQHPKRLEAVKSDGMRPAVIPLRDAFQQAELVAQRVLELHHDQGLPLRKMAVLYRNHSHSLELQVELTRRQIPFSVRSGLRFFEQAHIKDVLSYLRTNENHRDEIAWVRLLRLWPGIGNQTAERLARELAAPELPRRPAEIAALLRERAEGVTARAKQAVGKLATLWETLATIDDESPGKMIRAVVEAQYGEYLDRTYDNAATRREDLDHLAGYADHYPEAREFLAQVALVQGIGAENVAGSDRPDDQLVLSTVHQAKGLEWPIVFTLWLCEGRFPTTQSVRLPRELEEERRLFYVAATRAADELYLCYPTIEEDRDGRAKLLRPSRFLTELDFAPTVFERWQIDEQPLDPSELPDA